jgi:hypothetical protein
MLLLRRWAMLRGCDFEGPWEQDLKGGYVCLAGCAMGLASRALIVRAAGVFGLWLLWAQVWCVAQGPGMKTYRDGEHGVSFRYPAGWRLGALSSPGTMSLISLDADKATLVGAVVQGPGRGGGTFAYRVVDGGTKDACAAMMRGFAGDDTVVTVLSLHGVRYLHVGRDQPATGQSFHASIYGTQREGRCFFFEEDVGTAGEYDDPQLKAEHRNAWIELGRVMRSVSYRLSGSVR